MENHPYFDLRLHTITELQEILGEEIADRTTLHEWPLSCVQRITTASGTRTIYKVQHKATVEPEFYRCAQSPLLPASRYLGSFDGTEAMLFDFIDAPLLRDRTLTEEQALEHGRRIMAEIAGIAGSLPVYTDIGTAQKWIAFAESTIGMLDRLIASGAFSQTGAAACAGLGRWAGQARVLDLIDRTSAFTHGDPNGDNIFERDGAYRIIDWQRPRRAPREVDLAAFLEGTGHDPARHVDPLAIEVFWFLRINWFVECKTSLFPSGMSYDGYTADYAARILHSFLL